MQHNVLLRPPALIYHIFDEQNCAPMLPRFMLRPSRGIHVDFNEQLCSDVTPSPAASTICWMAKCLPVPILVARVVEESPCCSSKVSSECHLSYSRIQGATHATFRYTGRQEFFVYTARIRGWFELWAKMHTLWQPLMNTGAIHAHYITFFVIYMRLLSVLSRLHSNQRNSCKTWCWTTLYRYNTSVYIIWGVVSLNSFRNIEICSYAVGIMCV